jgi:hypothetical protein
VSLIGKMTMPVALAKASLFTGGVETVTVADALACRPPLCVTVSVGVYVLALAYWWLAVEGGAPVSDWL